MLWLRGNGDGAEVLLSEPHSSEEQGAWSWSPGGTWELHWLFSSLSITHECRSPCEGSPVVLWGPIAVQTVTGKLFDNLCWDS